MKSFVIIACSLFFLSSINGCKKTPAPGPTTMDLMTGHTWYLKSAILESVNLNSACVLSEQLTLNKDSTATRFFGILCDTSKSANVSFRWYEEGYNPKQQVLFPVLYFKYTDKNGKADSQNVFRVNVLNKDTLSMIGTIGQPYHAIYTSSK